MLRLSREIRFNLRFGDAPDWSAPVTNSWAGWPSASGVGSHLRLRAAVAGDTDAITGYLCNTKALDDLLRQRILPALAGALAARPTAERALRQSWDLLGSELRGPAQLSELELHLSPYAGYTIRSEAPHVVMLTQQFEFSAAHRLHSDRLSDAENQRVFGKCNNPNGHGHNYVLEITLAGDPGADGLVIPVAQLESVVKHRVVDRLDHKHLNLDTPEFRTLNPTVENIARVIWNLLQPHIPAPARLWRVRVWETPRTWAEYSDREER